MPLKQKVEKESDRSRLLSICPLLSTLNSGILFPRRVIFFAYVPC